MHKTHLITVLLHKAERELVSMGYVKSVRVEPDDVACIEVLPANMPALFGHDQPSAEKHARSHTLEQEWRIQKYNVCGLS